MLQVFICDRMMMMQQPHIAYDKFEMRVLDRQARNKTLTGSINSTVQRVKTSTKTAAFARWTSQKTEAVVALGKTAAGAMSAGIEKAWARIERSPGVPDPYFRTFLHDRTVGWPARAFQGT